MSRCKIQHHMRVFDQGAFGTSEAVAYCDTHHLDVPTGSTSCAIGRIEAAEEEVVLHIKAKGAEMILLYVLVFIISLFGMYFIR